MCYEDFEAKAMILAWNLDLSPGQVDFEHPSQAKFCISSFFARSVIDISPRFTLCNIRLVLTLFCRAWPP